MSCAFRRNAVAYSAAASWGVNNACDLTDAFQTGQSRLSFHLRVLKEAGLVLDRREGRWMYYALNREGLQVLEEFLGV